MIFRLVCQFSLALGFLSQKLHFGQGKTLPGKIILTLYPDAIGRLSTGKNIYCVSGTNGKTSTARFLASSLTSRLSTTTNDTGSNLPQGIVVTLLTAEKANASAIVLEVDELHLAKRAAELNPKAILLLNLSRDQLDRMHEVSKVANLWAESFAKLPTLLIGNVDDPYIAFVLSKAKQVVRISFGGSKHKDGSICPACYKYLNWQGVNYQCTCGLSNYNYDIKVLAQSAAEKNYQIVKALTDKLAIPTPEIDFNKLERSVVKQINERCLKLRLAKNPESWREALAGIKSENVILILNSRQVDGYDISWIWDISFAQLVGKKIAVTGERGIDLAYRLHVAGINATLVNDLGTGIELFPPGQNIDLLAVYTAYFQLVSGSDED
jgi:lipid II isoglutaminyl synthase (glutamine-hydrolysing)